MKAPSEKHLEDWIVANLEWFGDLHRLEADRGELPDGCQKVDSQTFVWPITQKILARQPRWPIGRPDLICKTQVSIAVVELKQGIIDSKAVAQCLRYMAALKRIQEWTFTERYGEFRHLPYNYHDEERYGVSGIIVGHTLTDKNLAVVAASTNINLYTYKYNPQLDQYLFTSQSFTEPVEHGLEYMDWASGGLGDAFISLIAGGA